MAKTRSAWLLAGLAAIFAVGALFALFGLLSLLVSKAVFGPEMIRYRTLLKNYKIPCSDVLHITEQRHTVQKTGLPAFLGTTKTSYRLVTKAGNYDMNSFEFFGLAKEMEKLKGSGEAG